MLAERELRETGGRDLSTDDYFDLVELATMSKKRAEKMARARRSAQLRAGLNAD